MPLMSSVGHVQVVRHRRSKLDLFAINVGAPVKIVITHPLRKILHVRLVGLNDPLHNCALPQEIRKARHVHRIEHVDFEEEFVPNVKAVEGNAFDERDVCHELRLSIVHIATIADGKGMVDREMKLMDLSICIVCV